MRVSFDTLNFSIQAVFQPPHTAPISIRLYPIIICDEVMNTYFYLNYIRTRRLLAILPTHLYIFSILFQDLVGHTQI